MIINWNPSVKTLALMRKVFEEKKTKTFDQLVEETGYSRRYLISLSNYYKDNVLKLTKPQMISKTISKE